MTRYSRTQNWIIDYRSEGRASLYRVKDFIVFERSPFQEILIVDTWDFDRALFLDGIPQSSSVDEHIYHEALVHPALIAHGHPKNIFIAGGGEGAVLRESLKHKSVESVIMVDVDESMIRLARTYMGSWHNGAFDNSKVKVVISDAREHLTSSSDIFDCVLIDLTDPLENGSSSYLYTREFFMLAKSHLTSGGVFAMQTESTTFGDYYGFVSIAKTIGSVFRYMLAYQVMIPFFNSMWGFTIASQHPLEERLTREAVQTALRENLSENLLFYNEESHTHMFTLPKYLHDSLSDPSYGRVITDSSPLFVE